MKSNLRNESKSYIVRQGMTMQEVVDLLHDEHGWSDSVSNLSNKLQRESLRYTLLTGVCASCGAYRPDSCVSGLFCVALLRTSGCTPCDACASIPAHFAAETIC